MEKLSRLIKKYGTKLDKDIIVAAIEMQEEGIDCLEIEKFLKGEYNKIIESERKQRLEEMSREDRYSEER